MKKITIEAPEGKVIDEKILNEENRIVFIDKEKRLPESWEEYISSLNPEKKIGGVLENKYLLSSYADKGAAHKCSNSIPSSLECAFNTREERDAVYALSQLCQLRDVYNDGWKPNWENPDEPKFSIYFYSNTPTTSFSWSSQRVLHFKTKKLRDLFLENFKDLIEIAKPLL